MEEVIFNNAEYYQEEKIFIAQDFSAVSLTGYTFYNCVFERCIFINGMWVDAKFHSCSFKSCNISLVNVKNCLLQDVIFTECKFVGIDFYKVNQIFFSISIIQSNLLNCNFSDLSMKKTSFVGSKLKTCSFKNTQLEGADFSDTDLQDSIFRSCNLSKANFSAAKNYSIDISLNKVKKAQFSYPDCMCLLRYFDIIINYKQ
jgi:fluoroquinolone resistance protein